MPENTQFVPISTDVMVISRDEYYDLVQRSAMLDIIFAEESYYEMGHLAEKLRDKYYPKPVVAKPAGNESEGGNE